LLEHQRRRYGKRLGFTKPGSQEAGQDQHSLTVQRPPQINFALDVDNVALAGMDTSGDAGGMTKGEISQL
jgi:hypothetical protein